MSFSRREPVLKIIKSEQPARGNGEKERDSENQINSGMEINPGETTHLFKWLPRNKQMRARRMGKGDLACNFLFPA